VQCVADEWMSTHVSHSAVDDQSTDTAYETPLYTDAPAHQTHVSVATNVQLLTRPDLTQPPLPQVHTADSKQGR